MIVIGTDTHKASHTVAGVNAATGEVLADRTVRAKRRSFEDLLRWARRLGGDRVWALEDCRHVSGALERFLLARGERVVRVAPKLTAEGRDSARERGKSDAIDAVAIARAAIRHGIETLPLAQLAGVELDIRLLVDHRERLVGTRTRLINDLRWQLHDLWPELEIPTGGLIAVHWPERLAGRLARTEQTTRVQIVRDELRRIRELTRTINALEAQLAPLVAQAAPRLLAERGIHRFATDSKLARISGSAPIPASSGSTIRYRLDRGGNRQINAALHRLALCKGLHDPDTAAYLARKQAAGKKQALSRSRQLLR
jgi:transposase